MALSTQAQKSRDGQIALAQAEVYSTLAAMATGMKADAEQGSGLAALVASDTLREEIKRLRAAEAEMLATAKDLGVIA